MAVETIDMTPTWKSLMPALFAALRDGTPTGQKIAEEELMKLAKAVDRMNAEAKAEKAAKAMEGQVK